MVIAWNGSTETARAVAFSLPFLKSADRVTVLNYGQVLLEGTPEEVRASDVVRETYLGGQA